MSVLSDYADVELLWANGVDTGAGTSFTAVAAPGVGFRLLIIEYKAQVVSPDTVPILDGSTEKDRNTFGAYGYISENFGNNPLRLAENSAFKMGKTANNTVNWRVQYLIIPA